MAMPLRSVGNDFRTGHSWQGGIRESVRGTRFATYPHSEQQVSMTRVTGASPRAPPALRAPRRNASLIAIG